MNDVEIGCLADKENGSFKIGPFGSSLKRSELVAEGIPVVGIENVLPNEFIPRFRRHITSQKFRDLQDYEIRPGDVLVTTMGTIGRAAVAPERIGTAIIDSHLFRMRLDRSRVYPAYLCYALNGFRGLQEQLARKAHGAIMDGLNTTILKECTIPLPSVSEQERIAAILKKTDRLRRLRRYARQMSNTFLQSVFLEMFGDSFEANRPKTRFGELVTITGGGTPSREVSAYFTGRIPWLTSKDMKGDYIWDTQEHVTDEAVANSATKVVAAGSILVVVKSKVLMHRLPLAISVVPLCHGQDIKSIQCSDRLLTEFARYVLKYYEPNLLQIARGANTEGLTLPMLEELLVPDVGLSLQGKFSEIVKRFERMRVQQREAERQAEHLFQSLLHRAFANDV